MSLNLDMAARIWRCALPRGINKLVLQCFVHHVNSNDEKPYFGLCWPSISRVARMCGMSERTVQIHIRALQTAGILRPRLRTGRTTRYSVHLDALVPLVFETDTELDADGQPVDNCSACTTEPAVSATNLPVSAPEPAENDTKPVEIFTLTLKELVIEQQGTEVPAPALPVQPYPLFEDVKPETLANFAACRKDKFGRGAKGKVTEELIAKIAEQATLAGMTLQAALEYCCHAERRWASFKAAWLKPKASAPAAPAPATPVKVWEPDTTPIPPAAPAIQPPPPAKSDLPEVAASALVACRAKLSPAFSSKPTPAAAPAIPTGATDIRIAADAPPWAVGIVTKHRTGQPISRNSLHIACAVLKLDPAMLRRAAASPPPLPACTYPGDQP